MTTIRRLDEIKKMFEETGIVSAVVLSQSDNTDIMIAAELFLETAEVNSGVNPRTDRIAAWLRGEVEDYLLEDQ